MGVAATGRRDDAIEQYRLAARLDSQDADIHNNLGYLLLQRGEPETAIDRRRINLGRLRGRQGSVGAEVVLFHLAADVQVDTRQ